MKKFFNKKTILILLAITLVAVVVSFVYKPVNPLPKVISSSITTNTTKVNYFDPIQLKLDQSISPAKISVKSVPEELWDITSAEGDPTTILLNHTQYFRVNTNYSLTIFYDNQQISVLTFKTAPQQNDPRYVQEVNNEMARDYPLATKVPYETNNYSVVYSLPLTLEITLKNFDLSEDEAIAEVKSWVTKNGGNSAAHKYVITP